MPGEFRFRKNTTIGIAQAELDSYLEDCFIDNGDLPTAMDAHQPQLFVVGRTGTGKSALLLQIGRLRPEHAISISPEALALNALASNDVLTFFENLGVKLDPFYKLLWRHVFTVELIKARFHITSEESKNSFFGKILSQFSKDKKKERAIRYLEEWGKEFWKDTEYRVTEITRRVETDLRGAVESHLGPIAKLDAEAASKLSEEQKAEIVKAGKEVVNKIQITELNQVINILDEDFLTDKQKPYYLLIDKLDDNWVDDHLRYKLILALLEAAIDYFQIKNAKVLVALRRDLMARVFRYTRAAGHQEEKYESLCIHLRWAPRQLEQLLDARIGALVREQYTTHSVRLSDLLPRKINKEDPLKYILDRTFLRPRDCIAFINECIRKCEERPKMTQQLILAAEKEYSRSRFRSVGDEWHADYPELLDAIKLLANRDPAISLNNIDEDSVEEFALEFLISYKGGKSEIWYLFNSFINGETKCSELLKKLLTIFYKVGFVGLRRTGTEGVIWSYLNEPFVSASEISDSARVYIHKAFWSVLASKYPAQF